MLLWWCKRHSFIHFRDRISSGDGSGGSNPSRTHNTSRFPAISDNSVGSTPRRDQARLANNILYQKLKTLRSFARNSVKSPVIFSFSDIFSSLEKALWPNWLNFFSVVSNKIRSIIENKGSRERHLNGSLIKNSFKQLQSLRGNWQNLAISSKSMVGFKICPNECFHRTDTGNRNIFARMTTHGRDTQGICGYPNMVNFRQSSLSSTLTNQQFLNGDCGIGALTGANIWRHQNNQMQLVDENTIRTPFSFMFSTDRSTTKGRKVQRRSAHPVWTPFVRSAKQQLGPLLASRFFTFWLKRG